MRPGMAVAPSASMTTSQPSTALAETDPTSRILPSSMRIESPLTYGSRHSPEMIVPRLTMAVFMRSPERLRKPVLSLRLVAREPADARIETPAVCDAHDDGDLVGLRRSGQHDRHEIG